MVERDRAGIDRGDDRCGLPAREMLADLRFDQVGVEVADDDQRGVLGTVEAIVERAQLVGGGGLERGGGGVPAAVGAPGARVEKLNAGHDHTPL